MAYLLVRVVICFYVELFRWSLWYFALWCETFHKTQQAIRRPVPPPKLTISAEFRGKYIQCTCSDGKAQKVPFQNNMTLEMALEICALEWVSGPYVIVAGPTSAVLVQQ